MTGLLIFTGVAYADDATVGLWIKNTSPVAVSVVVGGAQACALEAPVQGVCAPKLDKKTAQTIKKYSDKKTCTTNALKISCIAQVPAAGADVTLKRADGVEYKVRTGVGDHVCVEPNGLTDCFGKKLQ